MKTVVARTLETPENEFLEREQELFRLYLHMPIQFKGDWVSFRRRCTQLGLDFEDVLGNLIVQFNAGGISYTGK